MAHLTIDWVRERVKSGQYRFSGHALKAMEDDGLALRQIVESILSGKIIESYPDTGRGASCLISGFSAAFAIHSVCGQQSDKMLVITVYGPPDPTKWVDPYTRRKP